MKRCFSLILIFLSIGLCFAQRKKTKVDYVSMEEMSMQTYPQDTTASAVILYKNCYTDFYHNSDDGFKYRQTMEMKIKILKKEGLEWCNKEIPYYQHKENQEEILNLYGATYNWENNELIKTELTKENIFDEQVNDKLRMKKFSMPAAKVGSVITYRYTIESNLFYNINTFYFQHDIPVKEVHFESLIPGYFQYNLNLKGYAKLVTNQEIVIKPFKIGGREFNVKYIQTKIDGDSIPAMKDEPFVWCIDDYKSKLYFELSTYISPYNASVHNYATTWENIDKKLEKNRNFGKLLNKTDLFKGKIEPMEPNLDNASSILHTIKESVKWDDKYRIYPENLKKALENGSGSDSEVNFLLINALKAGGFSACPVLISTRSHGVIPPQPSLSAFNKVITGVDVGDVFYITDASDPHSDWNIVSKDLMVSNARIFSDDNNRWLDLTSLAKGTNTYASSCHFEDSKFIINTSNVIAGCAAYDKKQEARSYNSEMEWAEKMYKIETATIDTLSIKNLSDRNKPLKVKLRQSYDRPLGADYMYINLIPYMMQSTNPFEREDRYFPINFPYTSVYQQIVNIRIPQGYEVEEIPKSETISTNGDIATLSYKVEHMHNIVNVVYKFTINQLLVNSTEYENLKDIYAKAVAKNKETIVLRKIKDSPETE